MGLRLGSGFGLRGDRIRRILGGILALGLAILDDLGGLLDGCCTFQSIAPLSRRGVDELQSHDRAEGLLRSF